MKQLILSFLLCGLTSSLATPLPVPLFRQSTDYSCGPASLMAVLYYWNVFEGTESELFPLLHTDPEEGTSPEALVKGAVHYGLRAELKTEVAFEEIESALRRREPVIVNFQAWSDKPVTSWETNWNDGHYAVAVDLDENTLYLMDPVLGNRYGTLPRTEFEKRWHDTAGKNLRYSRAAIFISGTKPATQFPLPLATIE